MVARLALVLLASALALDATQAAEPGDAAIAVTGQGHTVALDDARLAALPAVTVTAGRPFAGPLLWSVLVEAGAIDPAQFHGHVRATVTIAGQDGYTAVLALGELSPEFENKQVILATESGGKPLGAGHLRVVVPGDKRGGRGVHDVASVSVDPGRPPARPAAAPAPSATPAPP